jgi:hypothetical protein
MKEKPILFSTPMVRAILEGRKSQTRRVKNLKEINLNPLSWKYVDKLGGSWKDKAKYIYRFINLFGGPINIKCPYGEPGDILWVRETWRNIEQEDGTVRFEYKATEKINTIDKWKPSIFMPKEACRIRLEVKDVRVERVQDISEEDAIAEGILKLNSSLQQLLMDGVQYFDYSKKLELFNDGVPAKESYKSLWESINGEGSWEKNPWVWVIEFKRI